MRGGVHIISTHGLVALSALVAALSWGCDRQDQVQAQKEETAKLIEEEMLQQWSLLIDELEATSTTSTAAPAYAVEEGCPLVYDFSIRWPLRAQLATETLGRFELRADPDDPEGILLRNRATGIYPIHRGVRHPGTEWWHEELAVLRGRLGRMGLLATSTWPGAWQAARRPLGVAAFFPALPEKGPQTWVLGTGPYGEEYDRSIQMQTEEVGGLVIGGETVVLLDARPLRGRSSFWGRYILSEKGRLLAATWVAPGGYAEEAAIGTLRLSASCDGLVMPPLPRTNNLAQDAIEAWTHLTRALHREDFEAALLQFHPTLRREMGDEALIAVFSEHNERFGAPSLGRPVAHTIAEEDGAIRLIATGVATDDDATAVISEVKFDVSDQRLRVVEIRATTDATRSAWNLFELAVPP